jgi:phospholipase/carboxylesterase
MQALPSRPALQSPARQLVVFLHGYGADGNDLIDLADTLSQVLPHADFISPHAPEPCMGSPMGRQWFGLTMRDPREYAFGVESAAPALEALILSELEKRNLTTDDLALIGFSQGCMMALHVGLCRPHLRPRAVVGLSGLLARPDMLPKADESSPATRTLLCHGMVDQVVPAMALFGALAVFAKQEQPVEWHLSPSTGHGIDEDMLHHVTLFLEKAFKA